MDMKCFLKFCGFWLCLFILLGIATAPAWMTHIQHIKEDSIQLAKSVSEEFIPIVEEEKYVSPKIKATIIQLLEDEFDEVKIDGTLKPVEKGKEVSLVLTVAKKNIMGFGYLLRETVIQKGIAK